MAYSVLVLLNLPAALFTRTETAYQYSDLRASIKIWGREIFCACPLYDTRISLNYINKNIKKKIFLQRVQYVQTDRTLM